MSLNKKALFSALICSAVFLAKAQTQPDLYGEWVLDSIVKPAETLIPEKPIYTLSFSDSSYSYSIGVNKCWGMLKVQRDSIFLLDLACTEIGGDERVGKLSKQLNYNGKFSFTKTGRRLVIGNPWVVYYLRRL